MRKLFPSLRRDETIINTWKQMKHKSNGTSCIQPIPKQNYTELPVKKSSLKPTTSIRFPQRKRWPSESCCRSSLPFVLLHFSRYPYHGWFLEIIKIVKKCFKRNLFKLRAQATATFYVCACVWNVCLSWKLWNVPIWKLPESSASLKSSKSSPL